MDPLLFLGQVVLALTLAPLLNGIIKKSKAAWQSRRGPGILQPWYDLLKYLGRESVESVHTSWVYRAAPVVAFGACLAAAALVPTVAAHAPVWALGDAVTVIGLLALARFALALAALDTGSNFGGMGTARELAFGALVEPALLLGIAALALPSGSTAFSDMVTHPGPVAAQALALVSLFIVAVAETGRIPVDNPDTHLELTMAHEGMILEYAGRPLGLLLWAAHLKQLVVLSLLAALFVPWGIARDASAAALALGLMTYAAKVTVFGLALGYVETSFAKFRIFRVPELLGAAGLLGVLAVSSTFVVGR